MADTLVIIPTFNAEEFLKRSIDSVLQQSVPTEVWVVDNQSTDGTRTLAEKLQIEHKNIKLHVI